MSWIFSRAILTNSPKDCLHSSDRGVIWNKIFTSNTEGVRERLHPTKNRKRHSVGDRVYMLETVADITGERLYRSIHLRASHRLLGCFADTRLS